MNEPNVNDINLTIKGFDFLNEEDSEVCIHFILPSLKMYRQSLLSVIITLIFLFNIYV